MRGRLGWGELRSGVNYRFIGWVTERKQGLVQVNFVNF